MSEFSFDDWIDAQLRNVPLPPNLTERLAASGPSRPPGATATQVPSDSQVEDALRDVAIPSDLQVRLRRIARPRRRSAPMWRQVAMAASLFLVVGLGAIGYFGVVTGVFGPAAPRIAQTGQPASVTAEPTSPNPTTTADASPELARREVKQAIQTGPSADQPVAPLPTEDVARSSPTVSEPTAAPPTQPTTLEALGSGDQLVRLPELEVYEVAGNRGVAPPMVRGYDLLFQLRNGEHPFVAPDAHRDLATTRLPFSFHTASFDSALQAVRNGELPPAEQIRVEDFIAAHDYAFPKPPEAGLALHIAASRSPMEAQAAANREPLHLLELAVQSASYDAHPHHPNWLIVAVDVSGQTRFDARLAGVRRALAKLAQRMGEGDRVTLLRFSDQATVVNQNATRDELAQLARSDALTEQQGAANLVGAIHTVSQLAGSVDTLDPRQVVVITGDRGNFDRAAVPQAVEKLSRLAEMNIPWHVIRLAADENDAVWNELAEEAGGRVVSAPSAEAVYQSLHHALTGWPAIVADDVSLTLKFNPQQVHSYRLLGHEVTTLTGEATVPVQVDLGPDQTAIGLYEVVLKPDPTQTIPASRLVASVEMTWRHPPTGQAARIVRPILRDQLGGSFLSAPAWFQEGVLTAKAAEALRGSSYAGRSRPVVGVLDLAKSLDPSISSGHDFQQLLELLTAARKLR
mgnify:CR=1 FL=1